MLEPESDHTDQVTPAHVVELITSEVLPRLDKMEKSFKESGLNGYTPYLKAFLEQYAANYSQRQAWMTVRADISHRLRFLSSPKAWMKAFLYGLIGALAWGVASRLLHLPLPPG